MVTAETSHGTLGIPPGTPGLHFRHGDRGHTVCGLFLGKRGPAPALGAGAQLSSRSEPRDAKAGENGAGYSAGKR